MPNKLSHFWQELKRRKVTRVITVYAAASFVILQLVEILAPSLRLPEWTMNLILVLLIVGFIIAVILSWIYDIHPDGGIIKTEPAKKPSETSALPSSKGWKIATYISFVVIVALIVLNIIPRANNNRKVLEKSIAVLPLDYLSEDPNKQYLANGVLDAITGHLSMIEGLRVMPRTSVEQYRENRKSAKEIGEELDVSYLIEGSFLMIDNQVKLTIQLVLAEAGDHLFFNEYDRDYNDIIVVQSEVAKTIAKEIEIALTPEEIKRIEKVPTTNLTAFDFYQRGREELWKYTLERDSMALEKAEDLYHDALKYDSTFAQAYTGLAIVYWIKNYWERIFEEASLDSVLILTDIALSFDDELSEAHTIRGQYFNQIGELNKAIEEFHKAIQFNPNDGSAYTFGAQLYTQIDLVKSIQYCHKALALNRGDQLPAMLGRLGWAYLAPGYVDKSKYYFAEQFKLTKDSMRYYDRLRFCEFTSGNFLNAIQYLNKVYALDSNNINLHSYFGEYYMMNGDYVQSLKHYNKWLEKIHSLSEEEVFGMHRIGWVYYQNGFKDEGEKFFNQQIDYCNRIIELGRVIKYTYRTYYDLAATYAFIGEKDKAYKNLRIYNKSPMFDLHMVNYIKYDPLFDSIRDEPEFQQILHDVEAKYQAEHERVRKWLEENDML